MDNITDFFTFINERHQIYLNRFVHKLPPPWTNDAILQRYRFCNIYRELDTVTIWIREHIRKPYAKHPLLWFMLAVARRFNWPPTLEELMQHDAWPVDDRWSYRRVLSVLRKRGQRGEKVYTSVYHTSNGIPNGREQLVHTVEYGLQPVFEDRHMLREQIEQADTLEYVANLLQAYYTWGPFLTYELVTDMRHTRYLENAKDKYTWASIGIGSGQGLARIFGRDDDCSKVIRMRQLLHLSRARWRYQPPLEMRDIEHSLCEFDKYERARLGQGRPRQNFRGHLSC